MQIQKAGFVTAHGESNLFDDPFEPPLLQYTANSTGDSTAASEATDPDEIILDDSDWSNAEAASLGSVCSPSSATASEVLVTEQDQQQQVMVSQEQVENSEHGYAGHLAPGMSQCVILPPSGLPGCIVLPVGYFPMVVPQCGNACPWYEACNWPAISMDANPAAVAWSCANRYEGSRDYNLVKENAFHSQGTSRAVQAEIDNLKDDSLLEELALKFKGSVEIACKDKNAHHVILKLIIKLSPQTVQFIIDEIFPNIWQIVRNKYGCQVVRDLVTNYSNQVQALVEKILTNAPVLCRHEYGQYVAQAILENAESEQRKKLEAYVLKNIEAMCEDREQLAVIRGALSGPASAQVATCVLEQEGLIESLAHTRRGSEAVKIILNLPQCRTDCVEQLVGHREDLIRTRYGRVVAKAAGIVAKAAGIA